MTLYDALVNQNAYFSAIYQIGLMCRFDCEDDLNFVRFLVTLEVIYAVLAVKDVSWYTTIHLQCSNTMQF